MDSREISIVGFPPNYNQIKLKLFMENITGRNSVDVVRKKDNCVTFIFKDEQDAHRFHDSDVRTMEFGERTYQLGIINERLGEDFGCSAEKVPGDDDLWRKKITITNIPPHLHPYQAFRFHFGRFGKIMKCFLHNQGMYGTVLYSTHEEACSAKKNGKAAGPNSFMSIKWFTNDNEASEPPGTVDHNQGRKPKKRSSNQGRRRSAQTEPKQVQLYEANRESQGFLPTLTPLPLQTIHFWSSFDKLPAEEGSRCLLVQNIDPSTHAENIKMHFESKKRSNGGPVEKICRMIDGLLIVFRNPEDCNSALENPIQKFDGKDIRLFPKDVPVYCTDKIVIKGVKESTSGNTLELYLESCSKNETSPLYCQKQSIPGVYLIEYGHDYDTEETSSIVNEISRRPLEDEQIEAQILLRTDCLKVAGLPMSISNDAIKLVLESKKRTNGGPVTHIDRLKDGCALVYFALYSDAERICERFSQGGGKLAIEGHSVQVQMYFHSLATDHQNIDLDFAPKLAPKPKARKEKEEVKELPKPAVLTTYQFKPSEQQKEIVRFLSENKKHKNKLKATFINFATVSLGMVSDVDSGKNLNVFFTPDRNKTQFKNQEEFDSECNRGMMQFLADYHHNTHKFDRSKLKKVREIDKFVKLKPQYKEIKPLADVMFWWNEEDNSVLELIGVRSEFSSIIEEINEHLNWTEMELNVDQDSYRIMVECGILDEIKQMHSRITYKKTDESIKLMGPQQDITPAMFSAVTLQQKVEKRNIEGLKEIEITFLADTLQMDGGIQSLISGTLQQNNVKAIVKMNAETPCIMTRSDTEYHKAVEILKKLISVIEIKMDEAMTNVVASRSWKQFEQSSNREAYSRIYIKPKQFIILVGTSSTLRPLNQKISEFLDENVDRQIVIQAVYGIARFVVDRSREFSSEACERKNIECGLTPEMGGGVFLRGKKKALDKATNEVNHVMAKLREKNVTLTQPGIKGYFEGEHGTAFLHTTENVTNCIILHSSRTCEEWDKAWKLANTPTATPRKGQPKTVQGQMLTSAQLPKSSVVLRVWKVNIIEHRCDVIINASNPELALLSGGVSGVIKNYDVQNSDAIQDEMKSIIRRNHGNVLPGDAFLTTAGNLPHCKKIIHAVGPRWNSKTAKEDPRLVLKSCIMKSLQELNKTNLKSIAIPAISCGVFGGKVNVCVPLILEAVDDYFSEFKRSSIKYVDFVEMNKQDVLTEFVKCVNKYRQEAPQPAPKVTPKPQTPPTASSNASSPVTLVHGEIQNAKTDVIVNVTTPQSVTNMQGSAVSKALLQKAGAGVLRECANIRGPYNLGKVFETSGGGLSCNRLYHVVVSNYDPANSKNIIKSAVAQCLKNADAAGYSSIVFPAIATGGFKHPPNLVAHWMKKEIERFSGRNLNKITIILYPQNQATIQAFTAEFNATGTASAKKRPKSTTWTGISHNRVSDSCATFGPYTVTVYQGDITTESSDVIVNSTNTNFNLSQGMISNAIIKQGGLGIQQEVNQVSGNNLRSTSGGNLSCKHIIHIVTPTGSSDIENLIVEVLEEVERLGMMSVSIPALATGNIGKDISAAAGIMRKAFEKFTRANPTSKYLSAINIVIFDGKQLKSFKDAIVEAQVGFFTKFKDKLMSYFAPSNANDPQPLDKLDLYLYSDSDNNIEKAIKSINDELEKVTVKLAISDKIIGRISAWEWSEIKNIGEKNSVQITNHSNRYLKQITVEGLTSNVMKASEAVKDILNEFTTAEATISFVTWQKMTQTNAWVDYPPRIAHILEKGYKAWKDKANQDSLSKVDVPEYESDQEYEPRHTVDLKKLDTNNATVRRKLKESEKSPDALPSNWDDMKGQPYIRVPLKSGSPEYQSTHACFTSGGNFFPNVISLERIQNPSLYKQYIAKREEVSTKLKNSGKTITRQLFHGTTNDDDIIVHGFDRSYAGKHATAYGRGVYFAINAAYSHNYTGQGPQRRMFLADVVTGDYCQGNNGMIAPPQNPSSGIKNNLFDSVVDNTGNPSIYVIFKDASAYPTYLLTYQ